MEKGPKLFLLGTVLLVFTCIVLTTLPPGLLMTPEPVSVHPLREHPPKDTLHLIKTHTEKKTKLKSYPPNHTANLTRPHAGSKSRQTKKKRRFNAGKLSLAELMKMPRAHAIGTFRFTLEKTVGLVNETIPKLSSSYRKQHGLLRNMSGLDDDYGTRKRRLQSFCASNTNRSLVWCKKDSGYNCTNERVFVDENNKVVFCAIPKVASTAWMMKLLQMAHKPYNVVIAKAWRALGELGIRSLDEYSPEEREDRLENYFKFIFVRHPLTRLVSVYRSNAQNKMLGKAVRVQIRTFLNKTTTKSKITFDEFVSFVTMAQGHLADNKHWQTYGKLCRLCDISYDFIGRQELLSHDAKYLFKTQFRHVQFDDQASTDLGNNVHRTNSDLETTQAYFSLLTSETKDAVVHRYGDDMEMFGYKRSDIF